MKRLNELFQPRLPKLTHENKLYFLIGLELGLALERLLKTFSAVEQRHIRSTISPKEPQTPSEK